MNASIGNVSSEAGVRRDGLRTGACSLRHLPPNAGAARSRRVSDGRPRAAPVSTRRPASIGSRWPRVAGPRIGRGRRPSSARYLIGLRPMCARRTLSETDTRRATQALTPNEPPIPGALQNLRSAMSIETFRQSLLRDAPPAQWSRALRALWHQAQGDWHRAHQLAQEENDADGAWVHAHLHRAEGDAANAGYWYRRAGRSPSAAPLDQERDAIVAILLSRQSGV
jgi:hypothetical protein